MVTWNALIDIYHTELIQSTKRWEFQMDLLEQHQPDVICLNEVQPKLLEFIMSLDWVKKGYYLSEIPQNYDSSLPNTGIRLQPFGNLILSKLVPYQLYQYQFSAFTK